MMMCCFLAECISVASKRDTHTHTEREREERVVVCAQKRSSFPRPKNRSLLSFFLYLNGRRRGKGKRDERETRDSFASNTPLCSFVCANTTTKAPRGEECWRRQRSCCHCWRRREEKKEEKEATLEEKEDTTMGKRRERRKRGEGVFGNTNVSKKKRETHLFPKTLLTRDAHTTRRRHAHNETTRRERERERERERDVVVVVVWLHNGDEKPKDDDDFENTRSKV